MGRFLEGVSKVPSPPGGGLGWGRRLRFVRDETYHHSLLIAGEMGFGNTLLTGRTARQPISQPVIPLNPTSTLPSG